MLPSLPGDGMETAAPPVKRDRSALRSDRAGAGETTRAQWHPVFEYDDPGGASVARPRRDKIRSRRHRALKLAAERPLERFPTGWNHPVDKKSLHTQHLEHILVAQIGSI
jgi:hypothetical protein